ncbi:hypothetical protein FRC04_005784 [Tulasnella sp. 424]|nr:hypothetical protein FRC04_005784 [Tulasnella sp. 424]
MRLSTLFAASFVSFAAAAAFTDIPACALGCLLLTINDSGSCILTDQACLCQDQAFLAASTACIQTSCSAEDDAKAAEIYDELSKPPLLPPPPPDLAKPPLLTPPLEFRRCILGYLRISLASAAATSAAASATSSSANAAPTNAVGHGAVVAGIVAVAALAL